MTYKYSDHLKDPDTIFSHKAKHLNRNIGNMSVYVDLLTTAKNKATNNETLGDRSFVKTVGKCELDGIGPRDRYIWVDNEVKQGEGGLLSSVVNTLNDLDFDLPTGTPECVCVKGTTRDNDHQTNDEYRYIALNDFNKQKGRGNIEEAGSNQPCEPSDDSTDGFSNIRRGEFPDDPFHKMYFTSITLLGAYILFMLYTKRT